MNSNSVVKQLVVPILVIVFAVLLTAGFMYGLRQLARTQQALAPVAVVTPNTTPAPYDFVDVRKLFEAGGQYGVNEMKFSPDGTLLAYTLGGGGGHGPEFSIYSFDSSKERIFLPNTSSYSPTWSPDGKTIAYVSPDEGEAIEGMVEDGKSVLKPGIWIVDTDGSNAKRLTNPSTIAGSPSWSPDGKQIVFVMGKTLNNPSDAFQIWIMNKDGSNQRVLTNDQSSKGAAQLSPNGKMILYVATESEEPHTSLATFDLWVMNVDGTGQKILYQPIRPRSLERSSWTPDGKSIIFGDSKVLWRMDINTTDRQALTNTDSKNFFVLDAYLSPDGARIAYAGAGLWIMDSDGSNKIQFVERFERGPIGPLAWSPDGKRILFINNSTEVWSVKLAE